MKLLTKTFQLDKAHWTSELVAILKSIRHKTEAEILSKLENGDERKMLEELAEKTVPRDFLSMANEGLKSIIDELIIA